MQLKYEVEKFQKFYDNLMEGHVDLQHKFSGAHRDITRLDYLIYENLPNTETNWWLESCVLANVLIVNFNFALQVSPNLELVLILHNDLYKIQMNLYPRVKDSISSSVPQFDKYSAAFHDALQYFSCRDWDNQNRYADYIRKNFDGFIADVPSFKLKIIKDIYDK